MHESKKTEGLGTRKHWPQVPLTEGGSNHFWGAARCPYPAKALLSASDIPETTNHAFLKNVMV